MSKCRRRLITLACFICCTGPAYGTDIIEETSDHTYVIDPHARLSIRNIDGAIRIYAGSGADLKVQAIKKAFSEERLRAIEIQVEADHQHVSIETKFPKRKAWGLGDRSGTVEYTLIVPATINITDIELETGEVLVEGLEEGSAKAHLVNGWLSAHNCFGDLDLSLVNGRLDVSYLWWENKTFSLRARSANANVRASLPPDISVDISAETRTGRVVNNLVSKKHAGVARSLATSIGSEPGATFSFRADNGNITIDKSY